MEMAQQTSQRPLPEFQNACPPKVNHLQKMSPTRSDEPVGKRCFDTGLALAAIFLILPLIVLVASAIFVMQGRPIFIKHTRLGRKGREFSCYKFRTMINGADVALRAYLESDASARAEWSATQKLRNDPRITPLGAVLRKTSVDELPQLFNIIRGEMSLVGPRPIVRDEVRFYGSAIEKYYQVRPGITGAWQVGGRSDTSYQSRVELDEHYVDHRSFLGDIWILAKTVPTVLKTRGSC